MSTKPELVKLLEQERAITADLLAACRLAVSPMLPPWTPTEADHRRAMLRAAIKRAEESQVGAAVRDMVDAERAK